MTGTVDNNVIDANHTPGAAAATASRGGNGVAGAGSAWTPDLTLTVTNNSITGTDGNGILLVGRGTTGTPDSRSRTTRVAARRRGGTLDRASASTPATPPAPTTPVCLNITGNTSAGSGAAPRHRPAQAGDDRGHERLRHQRHDGHPPSNTDVQNRGTV